MMDPVISLPGLATTAITGTLTLTKPGTTPRTATFPDRSITVAGTSGTLTTARLPEFNASGDLINSNLADAVTGGVITLGGTITADRAVTFPDAALEVQGAADVISGNWTARNHGAYTAIATATATDPGTPAAGHEFTTLVRNGTITIGGTAYSTAGALVTRVWHSGSWANYVYPHLGAAWTWTGIQTFTPGAIFGTDPGGSELLRVGGAARVTLGTGTTGNTFPGLFLCSTLTTGNAYIVVGKSDTTNQSALVRYDANNNQGGLGIYGSGEQIRWGTNTVGFFGTSPVTKPTATGSRGGNAALASLLTQLASLGLITDSTTA